MPSDDEIERMIVDNANRRAAQFVMDVLDRPRPVSELLPNIGVNPVSLNEVAFFTALVEYVTRDVLDSRSMAELKVKLRQRARGEGLAP